MKLIKDSRGINGKETMNIFVVGAHSDARSSERKRLTGDLGTGALGDQITLSMLVLLPIQQTEHLALNGRAVWWRLNEHPHQLG